jgi:hypothetical protein
MLLFGRDSPPGEQCHPRAAPLNVIAGPIADVQNRTDVSTALGAACIVSCAVITFLI